MLMKRAGAEVPSANRITLLRDADGDGVAEVRTVFLQGLMSPFGMVLVGNELFIANADALVKVPYIDGQTTASAVPVKVTDLPAGTINHHWTKNVVASADGSKLYVSVGSNSNIGENGLPAEAGRAAIWEVDTKTGEKHLFAGGLRNPTAMALEPGTKALWTVVNERDEIGSDLVPDYLTSVKQGGFYGWPWSYWGGIVDVREQPLQPDAVAKAIAPDFALGTHVAPLGVAFSDARMPPEFANGAFIGEHGSWNRKPESGYKVVFVPFAGGQVRVVHAEGLPDRLSSMATREAQGPARQRRARPASGALLVADDVGNAVWRVSKGNQRPCRARHGAGAARGRSAGLRLHFVDWTVTARARGRTAWPASGRRSGRPDRWYRARRRRSWPCPAPSPGAWRGNGRASCRSK